MYLSASFPSSISVSSEIFILLLQLYIISYHLYKMLAVVELEKAVLISCKPGISLTIFLIALSSFLGNINFFDITINQGKFRMKEILVSNSVVV